ncbi:MAG: sodium:solute symporter [Bacteroidota bacterium]
MITFETLDWIVVALYFGVLLGVAWWVIRQKQDSPEDYFLAGRHAGWFVVGASIFASNIGSEHVVGLAGSGASDKIPLLIYELHAWVVLMLGWIFLPFYARAGVFTMPEFLEKRFSPSARWFLSIFSLVAYVLTKVSVTVYAGGIVISTLLGIQFWSGALATVILTGIYTVLGGMKAVIYTEAIQTVVLLLGAGALTFLGLDAIGGWSGMVEVVGTDYLDMWKPANHPEYPWPALVISSSVVGIWYWCTDQVIVQRVLTAKNVQEGRRGTIFGGFLKLTPVLLFLIPGIIAFAMQKTGELNFADPDQAFPALMAKLLPAGLRGLVAAGLLAALMSSLASVFNSCSTLFTVDIYQKVRPQADQKSLVRVGRIATAVVVLLGILWIPIMQSIADGVLYQYLQSVQSYIAPPITAVFLLGIFSKRINSRGAMAALISGMVIAVVRLSLEITKDSFASASFLFKLGDMNFLHFSSWFFLVAVLTTVIVSLATPAQNEKEIEGLSMQTVSEADRQANKETYNWMDVAASLFVIAVVAYVMITFS